MSDSDRDLLFGGEDPFGDDDPFGGDDEWGGDVDEGFDDLGDDFQTDLGDEGEDLPAFGDEVEEEEAQRATIFGLNRRFVTIGALIALLLCVGIIGLIFVIQQNAGPSDIDLTVTAVYATNTFVAYALELTETQNAVSRDLTATAQSWTATPSPTPTPTETPSPSPTVELATQVPIFMTPTGGPGSGLNASQIELTATALAAILSGSGLPTPTPEAFENGDGGFVTVTPGGPVATALPDTGLFDAGFAGGEGVNGLLTAGLAALGLAAVIVVSRRLRAR